MASEQLLLVEVDKVRVDDLRDDRLQSVGPSHASVPANSSRPERAEVAFLARGASPPRGVLSSLASPGGGCRQSKPLRILGHARPKVRCWRRVRSKWIPFSSQFRLRGEPRKCRTSTEAMHEQFTVDSSDSSSDCHLPN